MRQIIPSLAYDDLPCSIVAVGCALGYTDSASVMALNAVGLHKDGYLSLQNMERLIKANFEVDCKVYFKRGSRPTLEEFAERRMGLRAIVCLEGHFVYFDGENYYSFFENSKDRVVQAWYVEGKRCKA